MRACLRLFLAGFLVAATFARLPAQELALQARAVDGTVVLEAACPADAVRLVWEATDSLDDPAWRAVVVQAVVPGTARWTNLPATPTRYFRAVAHDTPGFNARVGAVLAQVRAERPAAVLLEASAQFGGPQEHFPDVATLQVVCSVPGGTVVARQTDPQLPAGIEFRPAPWLGDTPLPWPIDLDLEVAESLLRDAGYGPAYSSVTLRQPIYPGRVEPYLIFRTPESGFVFVGTRTRTVKPGN